MNMCFQTLPARMCLSFYYGYKVTHSVAMPGYKYINFINKLYLYDLSMKTVHKFKYIFKRMGFELFFQMFCNYP